MSEIDREDMEAIGAGPVVVPTNAGQDELKREPFRRSMSKEARAVFDVAANLYREARAKWEAAEEAHKTLIMQAMQMDGLPPLGEGPGQLHSIGRKGDEWVGPEAEPPRR